MKGVYLKKERSLFGLHRFENKNVAENMVYRVKEFL